MEKFQHGGQIYDKFGKPINFLDFSANINPLGLSEKILQTLQENFRGIVNYPDSNATELKSALSRKYKISAENLILLNGAAEFFYLYCNVFRPKKILIPVPSFLEYERAAKSSGAEVEFFFTRAEENFKIDVEKILKRNADCVIIGRPNNPTGNLISIEEILKLAEKYLNNPVKFFAGEVNKPNQNITQKVIKIEGNEKLKKLTELLQENSKAGKQILVFVKTQRAANENSVYLKRKGLSVIAMHGGLQQKVRDKNLLDFRQGLAQVMIATDLAARGLDIPAIYCVINYELPQNPEEYVHRIGRSARYKNKGVSYTLIARSDRADWKKIREFLNN